MPWRRTGTFGDVIRSEEIVVERTDQTFTAIRERFFSLPDPTATGPPVTIISGVTGVGKTSAVKHICQQLCSHSDLFDQVGYFDARNKTPEQIFVSFFLHFSSTRDAPSNTSAPLPKVALKSRILLVIDDCEDWQIVCPFLRLCSTSHIVVTTQRADLCSDRSAGVIRLSLAPMDPEDATALLLRHAPECPEPCRSKILEYSKGLPYFISRLADFVNLDGPESITALVSGENDSILHLLHERIADSVQRIGKQDEIDLFCAIAHLKNFAPLPCSFLLEFWELLARSAGFEWTSSRSHQLLNLLVTRRLISIIENKHLIDPIPCPLLYSSPFKVVTLDDMVWDYCSSNIPSRFSDPRTLLSEHFAARCLSGKYDFLSRFIPDLTNNPVLKLLSDAQSKTNHVSKYIQSRHGDLPLIAKWVVSCLRAHLFKTSSFGTSTQLHPGYLAQGAPPSDTMAKLEFWTHRLPLFNCPCTAWAQEAMKPFLDLQISCFITEIQPLISELLQCPGFFSSPAVALLKSFGQSPDLAAQIIEHLEHNPHAVTELCQTPRLLTFIISRVPNGVIPSFFSSIAELLVKKDIEEHESTHVEFPGLSDLLIRAHQQGKLPNREQIVSISHECIRFRSLCWLSILGKRFKGIQLADYDPWWDLFKTKATYLRQTRAVISPYLPLESGFCASSPCLREVMNSFPAFPGPVSSIETIVMHVISHEQKEHELHRLYFDWLPKFIVAVHQKGNLTNLEEILQKMWELADTKPACWLSVTKDRVEMLNLATTHWIHPLLEAKTGSLQVVQETTQDPNPTGPCYCRETRNVPEISYSWPSPPTITSKPAQRFHFLPLTTLPKQPLPSVAITNPNPKVPAPQSIASSSAPADNRFVFKPPVMNFSPFEPTPPTSDLPAPVGQPFAFKPVRMQLPAAPPTPSFTLPPTSGAPPPPQI